ncbi:hypothetical protein GFS24_08565 [Chitinophaga sp. SYP-B3965]|uniref:hypothetical protein n=1 Tax=Chitinophaga sp. SYP-B3965 TaxID=2663120 RepID=UPI001299C78D|nr:hypothetical protein [Chitinophaga sp. SYP-B3965]MRG45165.1 hypothetical protein [Chitinophaga sp. SYP-B3965]
MARQIGIKKITGTKGNITFYKMNGEYYARMKSSLKGKRVKKDPAFRLTMMYAGWLKKASKIASVVYRALPEDEREHHQYRTMTGIAMKMLKAGIEPEMIVDHLDGLYRKEEIPPSPGLYVDNTGKLVQKYHPEEIHNNLVTLPPPDFPVILRKILDST